MEEMWQHTLDEKSMCWALCLYAERLKAENESLRNRLAPLIDESRPRTLMIRRKVLNAHEIVAWARGAGIAHVWDADRIYAMLAATYKPIRWSDVQPQRLDDTHTLDHWPDRRMWMNGSVMVMTLEKGNLHRRSNDVYKAGGRTPYGMHAAPLIVLCKPSTLPEDVNLPPPNVMFDGRIELGPEEWSEYDYVMC